MLKYLLSKFLSTNKIRSSTKIEKYFKILCLESCVLKSCNVILCGPTLENRIFKNLEVVQRYSKCLGGGNYEHKKVESTTKWGTYFFVAVGRETFLNICCGYPLQSFCSKAAKRISTSIRQPMIGLSFFNLFLGEVLRKKNETR